MTQHFSRRLLEAAAGPRFATFLENAKREGELARHLPEIDVMDRFLQDPQFHPEGAVFDENGALVRPGTVWDHTLTVVRDYSGSDPVINLGCLFHDIGKPVCADHHKSPVFHSFRGHDHAGLEPMREVALRLSISDDIVEKLLFVIEHHMKICRFPEMHAAKILRIVTDPLWPLLREVSLHDDRSRAPAFDPDNWTHYDRIVELTLAGRDAERPYRVNGFLAMHATGLNPGPELGAIIDRASSILAHEYGEPTREQAIEVLRSVQLELFGQAGK